MAALHGRRPRVVVVSDWDSDGVVSAALIVYAQERLGVFPARGKAPVEALPSGPRSFADTLASVGCPDYLVVLDIPATEEVLGAIRSLREAGCGAQIYYFDHHESTIRAMPELEGALRAKGVVGRSATAVLVRMFLEGLGARLTPRLRDFTEAVAVLEGPRRRHAGGAREEMVRIAASLSKALNATRSRDLWLQYVKWLSNPLPFEEPPRLPGGVEGESLVEASERISDESDRRLREAARDLAMSAVQVGFVKFVDARRKWRARGASALAAEISRITGQTTAVLIERADGRLLLVIRGRHGVPSALADALLEMGVAEDKGGHANLATCRLREGLTLQEITNALRRASMQAWRRARQGHSAL